MSEVKENGCGTVCTQYVGAPYAAFTLNRFGFSNAGTALGGGLEALPRSV
jgi:hypothetical protein